MCDRLFVHYHFDYTFFIQVISLMVGKMIPIPCQSNKGQRIWVEISYNLWIFEPYKNSKKSFIAKENSQVVTKLKLCTDYEKSIC